MLSALGQRRFNDASRRARRGEGESAVRLHLDDARFKCGRARQFVCGASAGLGEELIGIRYDQLRRHPLHAHHVFAARERAFVDAAGMARDGRAHGDAPRVVGVKPRNGRCAEHTQDGDVHRDADVHGARVRGDEEGAPPQESCECAELDFSGKDMQMRVRSFLHLRDAGVYDGNVHGAAHHGDVIPAREIGIGDGGEIAILPPLRPPARTDIERDDPVAGSELRRPEPCRLFLRGGRYPHLEPRVVDCADHARVPQRGIVGVDLVHDLILIGADAVKSEGKAGLCIADDAPSARERCERGGAFVAVEIDDEIVFFFLQFQREAKDAEEAVVFAFFVNEQAPIDVRVLPYDVGEEEVGEERDACAGIVVPQRTQDGRHEHKVAEMHEVDDEDVFVHSVFIHHAGERYICGYFSMNHAI